MGMCIRMSPLKNWKKKAFRINIQNIQQAIGIQVNFIAEIKLQNDFFLVKYDCVFVDVCVQSEPLLGGECAHVCHDLES